MSNLTGGAGDGHAAPPPSDRAAAHWPDVARLWARLGPPLRPSLEDLRFVSDAMRHRARPTRPPRALILGVTPELHDLRWPEGTDLLAIDHTRAMIDAVWPGPRTRVICGDWTAIPLADGSRDFVLCDGGLHLLPHPSGQEALVRTLARVIEPGGICLFRLFVPPDRREAPGRVLQDLLERKVPTLNVLKLRLGMALQRDSAGGVQLGDVWNAVHDLEGDLARLAARIGWDLDHLAAIDTYRGSPTRYHFIGVREAECLFCADPGGFDLIAVRVPSYTLGERCPTLVLRRSG